MVLLQELVKLDSSANVYKMIGPVLVKQDIVEAKEVVQKRIDYISGEV
jgi:prefoldin beta subunit